MCGEKKGNEMDNFKEFLEKNKEKIYKITESNTKRNENGIPIITKDDPWRQEKEWDSMPNGVKLS
jgi:hypothetical protein